MNACWVSVLGLVMVLPAVSCGGPLTKSGGTGGVQGGSGVAGAGQGRATGGATGSAGFPGGSLDASSRLGRQLGASRWRWAAGHGWCPASPGRRGKLLVSTALHRSDLRGGM